MKLNIIIIIYILLIINLSQSLSTYNILVDFKNSTGGLINLDHGCTTYNSTTNTYICSNLNNTGAIAKRLYKETINQDVGQLNIYLINNSNNTIEIIEQTSFGVVPPFYNIIIRVTNKDLIYTGNSIIINDGRKNRVFMGFNQAPSYEYQYTSFEINDITFMNWNMVFVYEYIYLKSKLNFFSNNRIIMNNINYINVNGSIHCNKNEYSNTNLYINNNTFKNIEAGIDNNYLLHLSFDHVYINDCVFSNLTGSTIINNSSYIKMNNIDVYNNMYYGEDQAFYIHYTQDNSTIEVNNFNYYNNHQDYVFVNTGEFMFDVILNISNFTCQHNIFLGKYDMDSLFMSFRIITSPYDINVDVPSSNYFNNITVSNNVKKNNKVPLLFMILDIGDVVINESNIKGLPYLIHSNISNVTLINSRVNVIDSVSFNSNNIKLNNTKSNIIINSVIEEQNRYKIKIITITIASLIGACLIIYLFCLLTYIVYKNIYKEHIGLRFSYGFTPRIELINVQKVVFHSGPNSIITNLSLPQSDDTLIPPDTF